MPLRYFPNRDQGWLEQMLARLDEEMLTGFVVELEADGLMGKKQQSLSLDERRNRILNDLSQLDPVNYNPQVVLPITRSKIAYTGDIASSGTIANTNVAIP